MTEPSVVVLGAGIGGVVAANDLRRRFKDRARIVLVDRQREQSFAPSYLWVMTGHRKPRAITRDITRLQRRGIEVIIGEVRAIDTTRHALAVNGQELTYDYLVLSLGAELAPAAIPGLDQGHTFYTLAGAERLRHALTSFTGGRIALVVGGLPYKCPAAPYEAAMLLESYLHGRQIRRRSGLAVYTPEPAPLPVAGAEAGAAVEELLAHKGIEFHAKKQMTAVAEGCVRFDDGSAAPFDLLVTVPPHRAPAVVREAGLGDANGWIEVDRHTLETSEEHIYAVGDITRIALPDGTALPKAGVFAHTQAQVVARNIAADVLQEPARSSFEGKGYCFLEAGGGTAGVAQGDFYGEPRRIKLRPPSRLWHWGKVAFERYWLSRWY